MISLSLLFTYLFFSDFVFHKHIFGIGKLCFVIFENFRQRPIKYSLKKSHLDPTWISDIMLKETIYFNIIHVLNKLIDVYRSYGQEMSGKRVAALQVVHQPRKYVFQPTTITTTTAHLFLTI